FPLSEVPEMARGKAVRLQKYKDGGVCDIKTFNLADGLTWQDSAERTFTRTKEELVEWMGARASAGRMVPKGFPRTGKFGWSATGRRQSAGASRASRGVVAALLWIAARGRHVGRQ